MNTVDNMVEIQTHIISLLNTHQNTITITITLLSKAITIIKRHLIRQPAHHLMTEQKDESCIQCRDTQYCFPDIKGI